MRKTSLFASLMCVLMSTCALGVGGNMGGADPNGSPEKPYLIEDLDDFDTFADAANAATYWAAGVHTKLTTDIDLAGRTYTTAVIAPDTYPFDNVFDGISFSGSFDGQNYTISNLVCTDTQAHYIGLFGHTSATSEIIDLNLKGFNLEGDHYVGGLAGENGGSIIDCHSEIHIQSYYGYAGGITGENDGTISYSSSSSTVKGCVYLGGLVGWSNGDIDHCNTDGVVQINISNGSMTGGLVGIQDSGSVTDSFSSSSVYGSNWNDGAGGLIGKNYGIIERCYATGNVSETDYEVGGLVGYNRGSIYNCYATGDVSGNSYGIGGLVGYDQSSSGQVINCYATGNVNGEIEVGGLIGFCRLGNITNCYSTGNVEGVENIGGLVGYNSSGIIADCFWDIETSGTTDGVGDEDPDPAEVTGKTTTEMMTQSTFTGWDFTTPEWAMLRPGEDYTRLAWQEVFEGDIAGLYGVDMVDFAYLANYWGLTGCNSGTDCGRADIDGLGDVGLGDLAAVANDWLK